MTQRFLLGLLVLLFVQGAWSQALNPGIRRGFEGTRANGMGGAFTAVADDNTAIFYNPAGLSQLEKGESNWFMKFDGDPEIADFVDGVSAAGDQADETQAITDFLNSQYGNHYSVRAPSIGFLWARPNWGLAIIPMDFSLDLNVQRGAGPNVNVTAIQDTTIAYSKNWKIKKWHKWGTFNVGVTGKLVYRMNVDEVIPVASLAVQGSDFFDMEDAKEGLTLDADVGFLWKGPWKRWNQSVGVVIKNIADYGYLANMNLIGDGTGDPENLNRTMDIGWAMDLPQWWIWTSKLAFDVRDMLHPNWNFNKGIHMGIETQWTVSSWFRGAWRAGLNQGYYTLGFTGEFAWFRLDLATYGEEVGVGGQERENRRYMVEMSLDF